MELLWAMNKQCVSLRHLAATLSKAKCELQMTYTFRFFDLLLLQLNCVE